MTSPAEPRRTAAILIPLVDALDEADVDPDALLFGHGLDRHRIHDLNLRLPASVVSDVFREAEALSSDATIGVRAGLSIRRGALDVFDYVIRSAATVRDAWNCAAQLDALLDDTSKRTLRVDGERAVIEYHRYPGEPDGFAEFALTVMGTFARQMTGQFLTADRVGFRRTVDAAGDAARFAELVGTNVEFGASLDAIEFPSSFLGLPLRTADAGLHKILERHAEDLLARLPTLNSMSGQVRALLLAELRGGNPSLVTIAEKLGTSARTLRRRVGDEGTSFHVLLDELRMSLSDRYLREERLTATAVAMLLGFSSASSFHRAFKRWYGTSPERYRSG